jgi:hypothetical protein
MNEHPMSEALDAIHKEAERLLGLAGGSPELEKGLQLIVALARYKHDVRSIQEERNSAQSNPDQ